MEFARSALLRRWYFATLSILTAALLVLRTTVLAATQNPLLESLSSITDNLIAAAITAIIVGAAYAYFYPSEEHRQHEIVRSADIARVISDECRQAREWNVRSRASNYFTTVTLSDLITSALDSGRSIRVNIQCIDPDDESLVAAYARSMSDIKSRVGSWSPERARREVYASILRAAQKIQSAPRIDVRFGLSNSLWVMSLDLSEHYALVTCQNKGEDALLFRNDSQFYRSYCDDFEAGWQMCRIIEPHLTSTIPKNPGQLKAHHFTALKEFYTSLGLSEPSEDEAREIIRTVGRNHDYA